MINQLIIDFIFSCFLNVAWCTISTIYTTMAKRNSTISNDIIYKLVSIFLFLFNLFFVTGDVHQALIVDAMRKLEELTMVNNKLCVQFRPKLSMDVYFLTVKNSTGCSSNVTLFRLVITMVMQEIIL